MTRGSPAGVIGPSSTISTISTNRDVSLFLSTDREMVVWGKREAYGEL